MDPAFTQISGWHPPNLTNLDGLFAASAGGTTAGQWAAIAANLPNREADVATFARIANWNPAKLAALARLFAANAGGRSAADWATIAAQLIDREDDVAAFARIARWNATKLGNLARLFAANAGGRTVTDWQTIAAQLIDREDDVATFGESPPVGMPPTWSCWRSGSRLNAGGRTAADWATIAAPVDRPRGRRREPGAGPSMDGRRPRLVGPESCQLRRAQNSHHRTVRQREKRGAGEPRPAKLPQKLTFLERLRQVRRTPGSADPRL